MGFARAQPNLRAPFGFTAQRSDPETNGLYYYRARHYSPAWGRFLQTDPIGYNGGSNLYAYVGNDPLNFVDPFGLTRDRPSASSASIIALPAAGASAGAVGAPAAAAAALGAVAVVCVLVCPSQMGLDQPMLNNAQTPKEILMPGGAPIGSPGSDDTIRTLPGGLPAAEKLYGQLSNGGTPVSNPNYPGSGVTLPSGGFVGIRPVSKSGDPAIDIKIPGIDVGKIHFPR